MTSLDFETTFHASRHSRIPEGAVQVAKDPNALHAKGFAVTTTESPVYTFFFHLALVPCGTDSHLGLRGGFRKVKLFGRREQTEPSSCFETSSFLSLCSFFFFFFFFLFLLW